VILDNVSSLPLARLRGALTLEQGHAHGKAVVTVA
jgi:hypothetical protein